MKIKEVSATISFTKNLGNYQSLKAEASIVSELENGENEGDVFKKIFEIAKAQVREHAGGKIS